VYNTWEVMWSRSSVKIVECKEHDEEHKECQEEQWQALCSTTTERMSGSIEEA